mgnify:CR=1 FL=1
MSIKLINKEPTFREILESKDYETMREKLRKFINHPSTKFRIDYSIFKKEGKEKIKLFNLKQDWKRLQKLK